MLPLIARLKDQDKHVRCYTAQALGSIGDPRATEPLITVFYEPPGVFQRKVSCRPIAGQIGGKQAVDVLISSPRRQD